MNKCGNKFFRTGMSVLARWCPGFGLAVAAAASAAAADLSAAPAYKVPPASAPYFDWSGFYGGVNVGGGWASDSLHQTANGPGLNATTNSSGVVGGGQMGHNWVAAQPGSNICTLISPIRHSASAPSPETAQPSAVRSTKAGSRSIQCGSA